MGQAHALAIEGGELFLEGEQLEVFVIDAHAGDGVGSGEAVIESLLDAHLFGEEAALSFHVLGLFQQALAVIVEGDLAFRQRLALQLECGV